MNTKTLPDRSQGERPARRLDGDGGSIVPEFALMAPFIVALVLGIFEFGMGWRESTNLAAALRGAARQVSNLGDARSADYYALQSFRSVMQRSKAVTINRVVVYRATGADGTPAVAACLTTAPPSGGTGDNGDCNIYSANQLNNLGANYLTNFGPTDTSCTGAWDNYWCPINRNADQGDPPDYVGVYANITYDSYTNLLPNTVTITDRAVMRIEPRVT